MTIELFQIQNILANWDGTSKVQPGRATEPTQTPGMFYHGSPHATLGTISVGSDAIFFTQIASLAAMYATVRGENDEAVQRYYGGGSGRIYAAEIITKSPFIAPADYFGGHPRDRELEARLCARAKEQGHDCIVSGRWNDAIDEIIVLDESAIRLCESDRRLQNPDVASANIFYCDEKALESFERDYSTLFSSRKRAVDSGADIENIRPALIDGRIPLYCRAEVWDYLNFDILCGLQVDCLIDPDTGDALALNVGRVIPLNRDMLRNYRRMRRKPVRADNGVLLPPLRLGSGRAAR